jgi:hypothetical protein
VNKNTSGRIPLDGNIERGAAVTIDINGKPVTAYLGESVATALLSEEIVARACMTWVIGGMDIRTQDGLKASN